MDQDPSLDPLAPRSVLPSSAVPIHPAEKWLTGILLVWLVFLPWALGTRDIWAQFVSLGVAGLALVIALYPRELILPVSSGGVVRSAPWRTLLRLPLVWIALGWFGYASIQALNPQWVWTSNEQGWWLEKRAAISWLPAGIEAPYRDMNAWRWLVIVGAAFCGTSAAWLGLTRRRSLQVLAVGFVVSACLIAVLGLAQAATGTKKIFWLIDFAHTSPFGTFAYKNYAAAYLLLAIGLAGGLALWHYRRGAARGARSTPAPLFAFAGALLAIAIVFSLSRTGALLAGVAVLGLLLRVLLTIRSLQLRVALIAGGLLLFASGTYWLVEKGGLANIERRLGSLAQLDEDGSFHLRIQAYELTRRMLADYPLFGIGLGGFRHPSYQYDLNEHVIRQNPGFGPNGGITVTRMRLAQSHNDLLQFLAEGGLVGGAIFVALLVYSLAALSIRSRRRHPVGGAVLLTAVLMLIFATLDFPLHNPAIVASLGVLMAVAARWADLEPSPR